MSRAVFVTDIDTSLGNQLVRLFLEGGDRVFATSTNEESLPSFDQTTGDSLKVFQWKRRSPVSARNMVVKALTAFDTLDVFVLLGPPDLGGGSLLQLEAAEIEEEIDGWVKGNLFLARELLSYFWRRRSGAAALVAQNGPQSAGVLAEVVRGCFRGFTEAVLRSGAEPVVINGFESTSANAEEYAAFIHRSLEEKAKRVSGRLFRHPQGLVGSIRRR